MSVAVLCAATNSIYHTLPGVDVYDVKRDARTFPGGVPVIAHPPCRSWSAYCAHQAKPAEGERELGLWCVEQLRECGGILEQPAHSRLFRAAGIPKPDEGERGGLWSMLVWQAWWGYPMKKATWLAFSGVDPAAVLVPYRPHDCNGDRRRQQVMSKNQRAATCPAMARWLVGVARLATPNPEDPQP